MHSVLLVEDDPATAEEIGEILGSVECRCTHFDNREDALSAAQSEAFCLAVVDLQIGAAPGRIRPHVEQGKALVRALRLLYPAFIEGTQTHVFPILVVSGFAKEGTEAVEVFHVGASDILYKSFKAAEFSDRIRSLLAKSGRAEHGDCRSRRVLTGSRTNPRLSILGTRRRRRTVVHVGQKEASVPDASLKILLALVRGKLRGSPVHKTEMGGSDDRGFKGVSNLNKDLLPATGPTPITANEYGGFYMLVEAVVIGEINYDTLISKGDAGIRELVAEIRTLRDGHTGNS